MLSAEKNAVLTQFDPGTPMGELLRRYWYPIAISAKLPRSNVQKVRLLGENLALYRLPDGSVNLLEDRCPHRGVHLSYGIVENEGLRCPYHGWLFDGTGACLEQPGEGANFACKVKAGHYAVEELGGLVFAYLGPAPSPALPRYDLFCWDDAIREIGYATIPCNFIQTMENRVDLDHVAWLHGRYSKWLKSKEMPVEIPQTFAKLNREVSFEKTGYGVLMRRRLEGQDARSDDWSVGHPFIFPNMVKLGGGGQYGYHIRIPIDNETTWAVWYTAYRPGDLPVPNPGPVSDYEVPWRDDKGDFRLDSVEAQDIFAWVSQGRIADRSREHLGTVDKGVIMIRQMCFDQMERVQNGKDPIGVYRDADVSEIINLPQESEKFGSGRKYVRDALLATHARFSPRKAEIVERYAEVGIDLEMDL
jgi:5,5'-dehydrodivanillate O-demethylase oxygenase subunit